MLLPLCVLSNGQSEEERSFSALVSTLDNGDQIAARPGDKRLVYKGEPDAGPISDLHCLATGVRISQMIPVLQEVR